MSIIIQAGHQTSKSNQLMQKMYERGLQKPLNSYSYNLSVKEVVRVLDKTLISNNVSAEKSKFADNVMVDFLLANLDQDNWGWQAQENLLVLNYWQQLDPEVRFVLVFDHPKYMFDDINSNLTLNNVESMIADWINYHKKMLNLFEQNKDKSILLEGANAFSNMSDFNQQLEVIAGPLCLKSSWQVQSTKVQEESEKSSIIEVLTSEIIQSHSECIEVYSKLLSAANIKNEYQEKQVKKDRLKLLVEALDKAKLNKPSEAYLLESQKTSDELISVKKQNEKLSQSIILHEDKSQQELLEAQNELKSIKDKEFAQNALEKENKIIITQLHKVQEELEQYYLESQQLTKLRKPIYYGAVDRVKQDLPYRLGSKMVNNSKSLGGIAKLPIELLKEYRDFKKTEINVKLLPEISQYQDVSEAEKVKKHLSYRLGKTLVDGLKSPRKIINLPNNFSKDINDFYK